MIFFYQAKLACELKEKATMGETRHSLDSHLKTNQSIKSIAMQSITELQQGI